MAAGAGYRFGGMFIRDGVGDMLKLFVSGDRRRLRLREVLSADRELFEGEFYTLALFAVLGMMLLVSAGNLLTSISAWSCWRCRPTHWWRSTATTASSEAAMKYFVLGALASGLLLYGMSMVYGATGSLDLAEHPRDWRRASAHPNVLLLRRGVHRRRHRLQVRRRAFPHVVARRLPGCADGGDPVRRLGPQVGRVRHGLPTARRRHRRRWCATGRTMLALLAVLSLVIGNLVAHRPDQSQAHAGVFDHLARRLSVAGHHQRRPPMAIRLPRCSTRSPTR